MRSVKCVLFFLSPIGFRIDTAYAVDVPHCLSDPQRFHVPRPLPASRRRPGAAEAILRILAPLLHCVRFPLGAAADDQFRLKVQICEKV